MMKWLLIVIISTGFKGGVSMSTIDFPTEQLCERAAKITRERLNERFIRNSFTRRWNDVYCVEGGAK